MADEVRQKFEEWARCRGIKAERWIPDPKAYVTDRAQDSWNAWRAAYEAGEIAMREKAAKTVEHFGDELTPEEWPKHGLCPTAGRFDGGWSEKVIPVIAKWIRAIGAAPEEKHE